MAACASMFSMRMIRVLLENNRIPFQIQTGGEGTPNKNPVTEVTTKSAPSIVAMVDSFNELPKELQTYLLSVSHAPSSSEDRAKSLILGGKKLRELT